MEVKFTWRTAGVALAGLIIVGSFFLVFLIVKSEMSPPTTQIIPWNAGEDSPYVCFMAVEDEKRVVAMSCLDTTLSVGVTSSE